LHGSFHQASKCILGLLHLSLNFLLGRPIEGDLSHIHPLSERDQILERGMDDTVIAVATARNGIILDFALRIDLYSKRI
jgi:hypothetical protein